MYFNCADLILKNIFFTIYTKKDIQLNYILGEFWRITIVTLFAKVKILSAVDKHTQSGSSVELILVDEILF